MDEVSAVARGAAGAALAITVTSALSPTRFCAAVLASANFRVVVRPATAGRYDVVVAKRFVGVNGVSGRPEQIVRRSVVLP